MGSPATLVCLCRSPKPPPHAASSDGPQRGSVSPPPRRTHAHRRSPPPALRRRRLWCDRVMSFFSLFSFLFRTGAGYCRARTTCMSFASRKSPSPWLHLSCIFTIWSWGETMPPCIWHGNAFQLSCRNDRAEQYIATVHSLRLKIRFNKKMDLDYEQLAWIFARFVLDWAGRTMHAAKLY